MDWQQIETAPDGQLIIVYSEHGDSDDWWMNVSWRVEGEDADLMSKPTHWMPLPDPPVQASQPDTVVK
jgi:hypothetical protein